VASGLSVRFPDLVTGDVLAEFTPPPHFAHATFATYLPDPREPSQLAARSALEAFAVRVGTERGKRGLFRRAAPPEGRPGVYLDGGFGVGKTHLLAALWNACPGPKSYGTFVEYTNLVGALGFQTTVQALSSMRLMCIDEFELDDPGDTVLMSTLLGTLVSNGVYLAATSNTLPDRLGEERFAAEDFLREIQGLSAHFDVLRIEGEDYRHRDDESAPEPQSSDTVVAIAEETPGAALDEVSALEQHLVAVHPSRYGALVKDVSVACWLDVRTITDQARALRMVVLIDRLYDREIPIVSSGVPIDRLFSTEMLAGGYRKKYFRALSRAVALARSGQNLVG
jgi:cell division protein ZapE